MTRYSALLDLVDRRRLRAMYIAVRRTPPRLGRGGGADGELVDLSREAYGSVEDVATRLDALEAALRDRGDRRAVFLTIYSRMTRAVRARVESGGFENPEWMRAYTVAFANYYRRAFLAFERGNLGAVPEPWRLAFGAATGGNALVVQDALLGINAHINYDLALAVRDVGVDPDRRSRRRDHLAINDVLAGLVDAQQEALADLYAPGVSDIDALLGSMDEEFSLFTMTEGREQAWRVATVMTDLRVPGVRGYARWVLRTTATGGALFVLAPAADPQLLSALRAVERDRLDTTAMVARLQDRLDEWMDAGLPLG